MNVNLTPYWEKYIQEKIASGRYNNASEVVREALRMQEQQELYLETRAFLAEADDPANRHLMQKSGPNHAVDTLRRLIAEGASERHPTPRYLLPPDDESETEDENGHRFVAEDRAVYRADPDANE
jgi:putative addiction module CopG family antidote